MKNNTNVDQQEFTNQDFSGVVENNCPMTNTLKVIGGKWKLLILHAIMSECPARFGELKKKMKDITQTTLTAQLRELERDGILSRKVYAETPPKVEYKLTPLGETLVPVINTITAWGNTYCKSTL